jgi:hypothetical protein
MLAVVEPMDPHCIERWQLRFWVIKAFSDL